MFLQHIIARQEREEEEIYKLKDSKGKLFLKKKQAKLNGNLVMHTWVVKLYRKIRK